MKTVSCIIVDDEPIAIEGIKLHVQNYPFLKLKASFSKPLEAKRYLEVNEVDLIFLDIEMPNLSGLDLISETNNGAMIIFTTAYQQYALESFQLKVIDYLLKPIGDERFKLAMDKVIHIFNDIPSKINQVTKDYLYIKSERQLFKVFFKDIKYIKGLKDYVIIFTQNTKLVTAINIKNILSNLPSSLFSRISKSYIVNIKHISVIKANSACISDEDIPIGKTYKKAFLSQLDGTLE